MGLEIALTDAASKVSVIFDEINTLPDFSAHMKYVQFFMKQCPKGFFKDKSFNPSYEESLRRVAKKKASQGCLTQEQIAEKLKSISRVDPVFLDGVRKGDFKLITKVENYPWHALKALEEGMISRDDFATIMIPWASKDQKKECIPLFKKDFFGRKIPNPEAKRLIRETLLTKEGSILSEEQLHDFFEEMSKKSPIQQQFFLESPKEVTPNVKLSIRKRIKEAYLGLNVFSECTKNAQKKVMIPSALMMQTFLDVKFKQNAVRLNFVLGLSRVSDIQDNGITHSRDMAIRFPEIYTPDDADGFRAEGTDFTYHDFFHAMIASGCPMKDQQKFIKIAKAIESVPVENVNDKMIRKKWVDRIVDMETIAYYDQNRSEDSFIDQIYRDVSFMLHESAYSFEDPQTAFLVAESIGKEAFVEESSIEALKKRVDLLKDELEDAAKEVEKVANDLKNLGGGTRFFREEGSILQDSNVAELVIKQAIFSVLQHNAYKLKHKVEFFESMLKGSSKIAEISC